MQPSVSTSQVRALPPAQTTPLPVQPAGAAGQAQVAESAVPWHTCRPGQATSGPNAGQVPTITQVWIPIVPQRLVPSAQAPPQPAPAPPSDVPAPATPP